jgi:NAD(P)-dependent dehydrogenase (short-subunit alcohol dehydrogenase family)
MTGKTCLVTGATAGIGLVTARELARQGARVVLVGRDPARCGAAVAAIQRETGNVSVAALPADLSAQAEVRRLAREVLERFDRLDVLVNNAGAMYAQRRESVDGIELTLALNHLGYFLLTNHLLDRLESSAPARIVNVSSDAHRIVKRFNMEDPQARARGPWSSGKSGLTDLLFTLGAPMAHPAFVQYGQTKLANLLFTYELARRLEGTGVTANALHPGFVATRFMDGNGLFGWFMRRWAGLLAMSPEEGAKTSVYLASSPEVEGVSGRYFVRQKPAVSSPGSRDEEDACRLWRLSEELTGTTVPSS